MPSEDYLEEFKTLEFFERSLSSRRKGQFKVFPENPMKREIFRRAFESEEAIACRNKVIVLHLTDLWRIVADFKELTDIAVQTKESGREFLDGIFAVTENTIRNAREELGGRIALMISQKRFNEIERIFSAIKSPHQFPEKSLEIYLAIIEYIEENAKPPLGYESFRRYYNDKKRRSPSAPDAAQDATNFRNIVRELGFLLSIPKKHL